MTINKQNLPTSYITEIVLPGLVEPTGLQINQRPLPLQPKERPLSRWRPQASRSPSSRCAEASIPVNQRSHLCQGMTLLALFERLDLVCPRA